MSARMRIAGAIVCIVGLMLAENRPVSARDATTRTSLATIEDVRLGFQGSYKVGYWFPISVVVRAGERPLDGSLDVTVLDGDGIPSRVTCDSPLRLAPGEAQRYTLFAKVGRLSGPVTVTVRIGNEVITQRALTSDNQQLPAALRSDADLFLLIGGRTNDSSLSEELKADSDRTRVVACDDLEELPDRWYGYEGVNAIIVLADDEPFLKGLRASKQKLDALYRWVEQGGTLLLSVGRSAQHTLADRAPLAQFSPGKFAGMVALKQAGALETYVQGSDKTDAKTPGLAQITVDVPRLVDVQGQIEVFEGQHGRGLPLVVRTLHGFGQITFLGFDLAASPLADWNARSRLVNLLLERKSADDSGSNRTRGQVTSLGYIDVAGQLRSALDQFAQVPVVPFSAVAALILLYAVVIGPLDYLLLRRLLGRMELTWLTFTVTVLLFSAGGVLLARTLKGNVLRANQVDIVDYDARDQLVRGTTLANVFSPRAENYDLAARPLGRARDPAKLEVLFSWAGLPGTGFGGMDTSAAAQLAPAKEYSFTPRLDGLKDVSIPVWSSKAFAARWSAGAKSPLEADLRDTGEAMLAGRVSNRFQFTLKDCILVYDRWVYQVGDLKPGAELRIDGQFDPQTAETFFRHITIQNDKDVTAPYDPASTDIQRILDVALFFELAGGQSYTGLANDYQSFLDLSRQIRAGSAVLYGRSDQPATHIERGGQPLAPSTSHWTCYRIVVPVQAGEVKQP